MGVFSLGTLVANRANSKPLVMLVEAGGLLLFDGQRLSEDANFTSDPLYRRLLHGSDWCSQFQQDYRFIHMWPDTVETGVAYSREVHMRPFRDHRMAVGFGHTRRLNEHAFESGITSRILDSLNSSMLVVEPERPGPGLSHRTLFASKGFERLYGYKSAEIVGRSPGAVLQGSKTTPESISRIRHALNNWQPLTIELKNYHRDGTELDSQIRLAPVMDDTGWYQYWVGFQEDAGERRRIAEELSLTQFVLRSLGVGIWRLDQGKGELQWDEGMYDIYDIQAEDFHGHFDDWQSRLAPDEQSRAEEIMAELVDKAETDLDTHFDIVTPKGERRHIAARSEHLTLAGSGEDVMYGINQDRTQYVKLQEMAEQQRSVLERQERYAAMGELAAGIGHEIRNPLQIAIGHLEAVRRRPEKAEASLKALETALKRIQSISDGLRNFGRIEHDDSTEIIDLSGLVHESLDLVAPVYKSDGIEFFCGCDSQGKIYLQGNRTRLQQVFLNLFANARDALQHSTTKHINITAVPDGDEAVITVADTGPGIEDEIRQQLFKVQITTKALGQGSGIGLQMVKSIVDEFHGRIAALPAAAHTQGAVFELRLPRVSSESLSEVAAETSTGRIRDVTEHKTGNQDEVSVPSAESHAARLPDTILLVDDEEGIRQLLRLQLANLGVNVLEAGSVDEGLSVLTGAESAVDIVLCDLNMPGKPGPQLVQLAADQGVDIPRFILLTGSAGEEITDWTDGHKKDIYAILTKPFRFTEVLPYLDMNRP